MVSMGDNGDPVSIERREGKKKEGENYCAI